MTLTAVNTLSEKQKKMTSELAALCQDFDGSTLSFPVEDGDFFVLVFQDDVLACALALCRLEDCLCECSAFTRPSLRCRGYFSQALACAESHFPNDDFSFVTDGHCPAAAFVLKRLSAGFWYCEHMMRLDFAGWQPPVCPIPPAFSIEEDGRGHFSAWICGKKAGSCSTLPSGDSVYLWGLKIRAPFRGKGFGKAFLLQVLKRLETRTPAVLLQVAGDNAAALNLYKKTGFRITETLSYYLY